MLFFRYFSVGLINTSVHWAIFSVLVFVGHSSQALANFIAFCISTTCSFFLNSKWTFNARMTVTKYILFVSFLGGLAICTGYIADIYHFPKLVTLVLFSGISLVFGFLFSKYVVFKDASKT